MKLRSNAPYKMKPFSFLPHWSVGILMLLVAIVVFVLMFPKQQIIHELENAKDINAVNVAYLKSLATLYDEKNTLNFRLVKQYIQIGELDKAETILLPYFDEPPSSKLYWEAQWLSYLVLQQQANDLLDGDVKRSSIQNAIRIRMMWLSQHVTEGHQKTTLVQHALAMDDPKLATGIFDAIISYDPNQSVEFYAEAGRVALGMGQYEKSGEYYFYASNAANTIEQRRRYFLLALNSLESGDRVEFALQKAGQNLGVLGSDKEVLEALARLALASGKPELAKKYIEKAVYSQ